MPEKKKNLYLFEALELRDEYKRHISLLQNLINNENENDDRLFSRRDDNENKIPSQEYDLKETEKRLKKLQTKRLKLNQEIQITNFKNHITFNGKMISITEALEIRKNFLSDIDALKKRVYNSAFKNVIYKEKRDIVHEPKHSFKETYTEYQKLINTLRELINQIHIVNHKSTVNFKDE